MKLRLVSHSAQLTRCNVDVRILQVLERGITMRDWAARGVRNFFEISAMVDSVCSLLDTLHASGRIHRDLKPGAFVGAPLPVALHPSL